MLAVFILALVLTACSAEQPTRIGQVVIGAKSAPGSCPPSDVLQSARMNLSAAIQQVLPLPECGGPGWRQIVSLDMGDPSQQCPSPWTESATPSRSCLANYINNCIGVTFSSSDTTYSNVCGQAVGYATGDPDAFLRFGQTGSGIDDAYLEGMSVTHGQPRQHIWSFTAGFYAAGSPAIRCPCDNPDRAQAPLPPSFVGDNYFCDGSNNGALWDAIDCTSPCCTFNSPPLFNVALPTSTTDDIEVRLCSDENVQNEGTHLRLLKLYVL